MKRGLLRREDIAANVYAFNGQTCVIKTDETFAPGDEIRLSLSLEMPFEGSSTPSLPGRIRNVRKYCSNFFYTVDFDREATTAAAVEIRRIQELLDRKAALTHRRKGGLRTEKKLSHS